MRKTYLGAVCGKDGSYGIVFKDFPGCTSAGDTIAEVLETGREALQGHIDTGIDYG
ncbi:MAG: type II toxin-antitoxin system HicB family antitoxin, partial [Pseudomonadota bacterium]